ncbi:MAG: excinuclease ABC subunit UvrC [Firmicutes bacterium]|nr:excinuclease ABC subunit UvrC [Alicyclobacillaceae bacterium]MCL6497516.1 excinuclease ABC subunit UvrC [Bacillota bacterium]
MVEVAPALAERLASLPERPGVYLMKDAQGVILYVGKAVNLKNRVRSYFHESARSQPKVAAMMRHVQDLEIIATDTEVEALILEATLVKQHQPRYNIRLKDDKAYPYLRLTWEEEYPRLLVARRPARDGSRYFGPYTRAQSVHDTIRLLRKIFPIRNCTNQKFKNQTRPCLEYYIKRCQAPCQGMVDRERYRAMMAEVEWFLEGRTDEVVRDLRRRLEEEAEALRFERAAELRDQIRAVEEITAQQKVAHAAGRSLDAIAWVVEGGEAFVQIFTVREGRLKGRESLTLDGVEGVGDDAIARALILQFYARTTDIPPEILLAAEPEEAPSLKAWLAERAGGRVALRVPRRGEKAELLRMVRQNAELARDEAARRRQTRDADREEGLLVLQHSLGLPTLPRRIECYDISNTQGQESVASMVVFRDGRPDKSQYRRFRIAGVVGPNDFASMAEVIRRRFRYLAAGAAEGEPRAAKFAERPDLVVVDGGPGQVAYAARVLEELGFGSVPLFGLAKEHEWLYAPGQKAPIILDRRSPGLKLLQQVRDEAHRFALGFHRQLRTRRNLRSMLDDVPGIGPKRKRVLLRHYRDVEAMAQAPVEELAQLPGMTARAAEALKAYLNQTPTRTPSPS